jgi:hypothetical protein
MARKTKSKGKSKKQLWTPPYNHAAKRFKSKEEWTKADWAAYRKAKREGRIAAAKQAKKQLRGPKGKFASKTPKKKPAEVLAPAAAALVGPSESPVWVMEECQPTFTGLHDKVAVPIEETRLQVAQIQRDLAEMKGKLRLAPRQPSANPIETLAIINRTERPDGMLSKLLDSAKDNPLLALAAIAAAIFAGYMIYRNIRRGRAADAGRAPDGPAGRDDASLRPEQASRAAFEHQSAGHRPSVRR